MSDAKEIQPQKSLHHLADLLWRAIRDMSEEEQERLISALESHIKEEYYERQ